MWEPRGHKCPPGLQFSKNSILQMRHMSIFGDDMGDEYLKKIGKQIEGRNNAYIVPAGALRADKNRRQKEFFEYLEKNNITGREGFKMGNFFDGMFDEMTENDKDKVIGPEPDWDEDISWLDGNTDGVKEELISKREQPNWEPDWDEDISWLDNPTYG